MVDWMPFRACALGALWIAAAAAPAATDSGPATGLDRDGMNAAIRPQDDLFGAMNGKWLDQTPIPPDKAEYGISTQCRAMRCTWRPRTGSGSGRTRRGISPGQLLLAPGWPSASVGPAAVHVVRDEGLIFPRFFQPVAVLQRLADIGQAG